MTVTNNDNNPSPSSNAVKESQIRMMTRLASKYRAVNLSQGFPNESPPWCVKLALAHGVLSGRPFEENDGSGDTTTTTTTLEERLQLSLSELLLSNGETKATPGTTTRAAGDQLNQYSPPCGRSDLRASIANYYKRFYDYDGVGAEDVTVTLGATEALASALRTLGKPGDKCVIFEPFHELYPSQCQLFYLDPVYVTLRPSMETDNKKNTNDNHNTNWTYDQQELEQAMDGARILVLNTPHNPTGKVFSREELAHICSLCIKHDVYLVTDDIYEHMCYGNDGHDEHDHDHEQHTNTHKKQHLVVPQEFPEMVDRTLLCNSLGKSASATGWRLGWCVHPPHLRDTYRGIHDQLAVMSPHPMQYATLSYLRLPDSYFADLKHKYKRRVTKLGRALSEVGFGVTPPQGAYYLFVEYNGVRELEGMTSEEAAMHLLLNVGVACVPGDNFYGKKWDESTKNKYLRFAACRSDDDLDEAIRLLKEKIL
eukprot:CAMPEP_0168174460 /NCGR_PEP_ID=MMETSP0139_2-20121125/6513_1 /TAXON_ID=44445 /ORGANISM="Pseudo-nitzschia australis, Strain 10249 10 AB" /LENGTH=481 /DNA_ID=CAMNT_0008092607 /DNA_START=67 /DNA_END=1512 /DNA_ORIENTATION=+